MKLLGLAFLISAVAACGDNAANHPPPAADQTQALCDLYKAACERQAECGVYIFTRTMDADACEAALDCEGFAAGAASNDVTISVPDATACRATIEADSCEELVPWQGDFVESIMTTDAHCKAIFAGTRKVGDECSWSQQCEPGNACAGDTCPGHCVAGDGTCSAGDCASGSFCDGDVCRPRAKLGAACSFSNNENACEDGSWCDLTDPSSPVCTAVIAAGDSCPFANYFLCAGDNTCRDGTCQAPLQDGEGCSTATECAPTSFCDFENGNVCAPTIALGQACPMDLNSCGLLAECTDGVCKKTHIPTVDGPVTTKPFAQLGGDCSEANCGAGLACMPSGNSSDPTWTCVTAPKAGEVCQPATDDLKLALEFSGRAAATCAEGVCNILAETWTCEQPKPVGASCTGEGITAECASLQCHAGVCADPFEDCE